MRCYILRHGIAVDAQSWNGSDFDRPLTREGRERMADEAKAIEGLCKDLDRIVTSPLLRAKQTAEIVADRLHMNDKVVEDPRLAAGFNLERFGAIVAAARDADGLMLVGHEPTLSATLGDAIGHASIELKKAALAAIDVDEARSPHGTLIFLIPPRVLAALGKR